MRTFEKMSIGQAFLSPVNGYVLIKTHIDKAFNLTLNESRLPATGGYEFQLVDLEIKVRV